MRKRYNFCFGTLTATVTSSTGSLQSNELSYFPPVNPPDIVALTLNPQGSIDPSEPPAPEVVWVTNHGAGSNTASVIRGCEGSTALSWGVNTRWAHTATGEDYVDENLVVNGSFAAVDPIISTNAWRWNYSSSLGVAGTFTLSNTPPSGPLGSPQVQRILANSTGSSAFITTATVASPVELIPVYPNETLKASAYTSSDTGTATTSGGAYLVIQLGNISGGSFVPASTYYQRCTTLSTSWSRFDISIPVPLTGVTYASVGVGAMNPNPVGGIYFAQVSCVRSDPEPFPIGLVGWYPALTVPTNFLTASGSSLSVNDYGSLFSVIGYTYGGAGSTFNLPNLQNVVPIGAGGSYGVGASGGSTSTTLSSGQIPRFSSIPVSMSTPPHYHDINDVQHEHPAYVSEVGPPDQFVYTVNTSSAYQIGSTGGLNVSFNPSVHIQGAYTGLGNTQFALANGGGSWGGPTGSVSFGSTTPSSIPTLPPFVALTPCIRFR